MRDVEVSLEGFGQVWKPKNELIDLEVTLGQNDKSSNCMITLSDPLGLIASALISHTINSGGIRQLTPNPNNSPVISNQAPESSKVTPGNGNVGVESTGEPFTPQVKAFLDMIAVREVGGYFSFQITREWYFTGINNTRFTEAEAAKGYPTSITQWTRASGRYQIIPKTWRYIQSRNPGKFKDFLPTSQDRAAFWLMGQRKMIAPLLAGDIREAIRRGRNEWTSLPGAAEQQTGWTVDAAIAYYNERLAFYNKGSTVTPVATKVEPDISALRPSIPETVQEVIKGNKIIIDWCGVSFEFFHQGTKWDETGKTQVMGQGIRWVLNRRKRNKTVKDTSLRQLAQAIAEAHKIKLDWQSTLDPLYQHIDQSGISDYQLLIREANYAGLWVSENNGALTIKSRDKINDTGFTITREGNLIKYEVVDKALDKNQEESSLLQEEPKATVEPLTGEMLTKNIDVDPARDISATGNQTKVISGTPSPGQDALLNQSRSRFKRVKGLPSRFTVNLSPASMPLKPLDGVRTLGFPSPLDRIWLVDKVTHKLASDTSTLDVYSPVEVLDNTPADTPNAPMPQNNVPDTPGVWVYPCTGTVTSGFGLRNTGIPGASRNHKGIDIANKKGTPIYAARDGVVVAPIGFQGGAGNMLKIRHDNGWATRYLHNTTLLVKLGEQVKKGQQIATMGSTGIGSGDHCHFETLKNGVAQNPANIFKKLGTRLNSVIGGAPVE
ncbi:MAG: peptidoglycan DD-metalloendopeptidase family protein [Trichormus sp. ATA11-4-KO1]|jgi:murein DD-endopeptidase MepM/ murein hydrolase activator NlpD|nr:peptidoglycan DD-metalloendopeptidase family protein [Trichormus sp. ATA11-4-KO1]